MDYDVYSYTKSELIDILELDDPTRANILYKCQLYISKFRAEFNPDMEQFFASVYNYQAQNHQIVRNLPQFLASQYSFLIRKSFYSNQLNKAVLLYAK